MGWLWEVWGDKVCGVVMVRDKVCGWLWGDKVCGVVMGGGGIRCVGGYWGIRCVGWGDKVCGVVTGRVRCVGWGDKVCGIRCVGWWWGG